MKGQWRYDPLLEKAIGGPSPSGVPFIWKWETVSKKLLEACEVMPESFRARRNFNFLNPGLSREGTTQTIMMGMQIVKSGEVAWAHRHSIGALRFVIDGSSRLQTVVDGEALPMETNDLVLTPSWTWHDHRNESDKSGLWLDVLDLPLILALNQPFYQPLGEEVQTLRQRDSVTAGCLRYPWRSAERLLKSVAADKGSAYDGVLLEYVNPVNGGSALSTMSCCIQLLQPELITKDHRRSASTVYYVVEGEGTTIAEDQELKWTARDAFAIPNWTWHRHINHSRKSAAILFSVTDRPLLSALGLYREEPKNSFPIFPSSITPERISKQEETIRGRN
jgi:gentisate 1,2-dioxygenase